MLIENLIELFPYIKLIGGMIALIVVLKLIRLFVFKKDETFGSERRR